MLFRTNPDRRFTPIPAWSLESAIETDVKLAGADRVEGNAKAIVLMGKPDDENTLAEPTKVAPMVSEVDLATSSFRRIFPAHLVIVLRIEVGG